MCDCAGSPFRRCRFGYVNFSWQELYRSLWEDLDVLVHPLGVLAWSCTGPCEKIVWRSCWKPPQESLPLRSWRCSALVLVWKFFWDAHRKFLYKTFLCRPFETLWGVLVWGFGMRSWWVDTALLLVLVILFHSYCCLYWYIDFLPPKLFGVSCRCIFLWGVIPTQNSIFEASNFQVIN